MEDETLNTLKNMIMDHSQNKTQKLFYEGNELDSLMSSPLEFDQKRQLLEKLYLVQLYGDAYLSADPRLKEKKILKLRSLLDFGHGCKPDELNELLDEIIEDFKAAETNPYDTACRVVKDREKYSRVVF